MGFFSTHGQVKGSPYSEDDVAPGIGLGVDGYTPIVVAAQWVQTGKYKIPLMSPSRGKIILRRDGVEDLSSRPNVYMPIWKAPSRGRINVNIGGTALTPLNSYTAGQVNVNAFLANSDLTAAQASQFVNGKSARYAGSMAQTAGD